MDRAFPQSEILHCDRTETARAIGYESERNLDYSTVSMVLLHRGGKQHAHEQQPPGKRQSGLEFGAFSSCSLIRSS